jgi:starch synthase (maltosyl-transferring)
MSSQATHPIEVATRNGLTAQGEGRRRVIIERVSPEIDSGRYPIKRIVGDTVEVSCDAFADGHDLLTVMVRYRGPGETTWREQPLHPLGNDRWSGTFTVEKLGTYHYTIVAWIDRFATWQHALQKRIGATQDLTVDLLIGANLVAEAIAAAPAEHLAALHEMEQALRNGLVGAGTSSRLADLMGHFLPHLYPATYERTLAITVDRPLARCSAWYELFPRSAAPESGRHGTFRDLIARLPYVAALGFDVLYLPPIHPIGRTFRKGKNNSVTAQPGDPGSPWAIGAAEGGHKSIHPELGSLEEFHQLVHAAQEYGIALALDIAFQCSPDHPYVTEHPEWFRSRPDGSIQYAENPPKKYQDIYPFDFESSDWQGLWYELKSVFEFWIAQGVTIFRVDNPHTKSFPFWEWCISELKRQHPELIFLSEAFTRPKMMYGLAKLGFTQSYTYFTWRTTKGELIEYMRELTQDEPREFFGPNFWPNTPDILTPQFYRGDRSVFLTRATLAATLSANWGLYGPVYELLLHTPVQGREEYINSEKYEIHHWNLSHSTSINWFIAALNRIRRTNPALQSNHGLRFHRVDLEYRESEQLLAYSKATPDLSNIILVVVNLDPSHTQSGWVELPTAEWQLGSSYEVHDLLSGAHYPWSGTFNYVELNPRLMPVHIFHIRRGIPVERELGAE